MYRWKIEVIEYNTYGDKVTKLVPMSVLAESRSEVTAKVRAAFEATYDNFRKFWSHSWRLTSVSEELPVTVGPNVVVGTEGTLQNEV